MCQYQYIVNIRPIFTSSPSHIMSRDEALLPFIFSLQWQNQMSRFWQILPACYVLYLLTGLINWLWVWHKKENRPVTSMLSKIVTDTVQSVWTPYSGFAMLSHIRHWSEGLQLIGWLMALSISPTLMSFNLSEIKVEEFPFDPLIDELTNRCSFVCASNFVVSVWSGLLSCFNMTVLP